MSTLINLIISIFMGAAFGNQMEEPSTVQQDLKKDRIELKKELELKQKILEC